MVQEYFRNHNTLELDWKQVDQNDFAEKDRVFSIMINPIPGGVFYVRWPGVVQNYPKSSNKGDKLISHKTYPNTSPL